MKLSDLVELAKAGYKFSEIKELLEYVETSPAVQEAAPMTPEQVPEHIEVPVEPQPQAKPTEEDKLDGESVLDNLLK